ncbi:MAG: DUF2236 domain-containing protein [Saprospiraceae bacterium]|nr:DUF2236 domain-containing protein [Saprospiraceae bacterium]MBK7435909.1 DUF2236 domain-containing protein [Saprospiraceae bacterium]MBP7802880.1 DUF2236 domain-containing protein [Saprospiraceae bacterium]
MENEINANSWNDSDLNEFRHIMDPDADAAVQSLYKSVRFKTDRDELRAMAANDAFVPADLPDDLRLFVEKELSTTFTADDISKFEMTREIWKENGVQFIFILFFRALPYTYMAEKPANVLRLTKLLEDQPTRRVFETAQFVFDIMDKDWWDPEHRGILTALKVRIMHAAMRYNLLTNPEGEPWNKEAWGMPISQEDLIATNQCFSLEFFKGLDMLGQPLNAEQQEAWFHTWKAIGKIMGIEDRLLANSVPEAWDLQLAIYKHLFLDIDHASGIALAKALVECISTFLISTKFTLMLMKKMIKDDNYPDLFFEVLGPSFGAQYPSLFKKSRGDEAEDGETEEQLNGEFHEELMKYNESVKNYRTDQKLTDPTTSRGDGDKNLVDFQLDVFDEVLQDLDPNNPNSRGIKEEIIKKAMSSIGGVVVGILAKYFREGKQSGFRIPVDLKEHWAL